MAHTLFSALLLTFFLFFCGVLFVRAIPAGEQKAVNKAKAYLSDFLNDDQLHKICENVSIGIYEMRTLKQLADDIQTIVTDSLTNTQLATILPIINALNRDFGSLSAAKEAMDPMSVALSNNLKPFVDQMQAKDTDWTNEGKGQKACIEQEYRMINSFLTVVRTKTLFTRMKDATPPKNWTYIYNDLKGVIFFEKYVTA